MSENHLPRPKLPIEVRTQPLIASSIARRVGDPGSQWYQEMNTQMDAFSAAGDLSALRIGEGYEASDYMPTDKTAVLSTEAINVLPTLSPEPVNGAEYPIVAGDVSVAEQQRIQYLGRGVLGIMRRKQPTIMERWGQEQVSDVFSILHKGEELEFEPESRSVLERFRPDTTKFPRPELDSLHDKGHLPRTLVWLKPIASLLPEDQQQAIDWDVLRAAAVLHDIGRQGHERNAHAHGKRGKELVEDADRLKTLLPNMGTDAQNSVSNEQVADIAYLIEKHHEFDHDAANIDLRLRTMLAVLQTADGLDLARGFHIHGKHLGKHILDRSIKKTERIDDKLRIIKHTLRIPGAEKLRQAATVYATETRERIESGEDEYTTCMDVAEKVGLIAN